MSNEFLLFGLQSTLLQAIEERGYEEPTAIQKEIIPLMIEANDVIAQSQTGTGKTAAFSLPILNMLKSGVGHVQCLVLAPTRELVMQVAEIMHEYGKYTGVRVLPVFGGQNYDNQIRGLKKGTDIVVGTPGRLLDLIRREVLDLSHVRHLVIDEADEMLSMGFIEDVETILEQISIPHQTALFSATMPQPIVSLANKYMYQPVNVKIEAEHLTVESIEQRYYIVNEKDKISALTRLFEIEDITSALIFTKTRERTGDVANELTQRGYPAEAINGDLSQDARIRVLNRFKNNQIKVLVATDVAARGLDIEDISHVINYDMPYEEEAYVHRIGRTGRAGKSGIAISIINPKEEYRMRRLERFINHPIVRHTIPTKEEILNHRTEALMLDLQKWLNRDRCKQELVLIDELVNNGNDIRMIAAVALKMARAQERQRPIWDISEVEAPKPRRERDGVRSSRNERYDRGDRSERGDQKYSERSDRKDRKDWKSGKDQGREGSRRGDSYRKSPDREAVSNQSHENGMVRLSLNVGATHNARPRDVVGMLAYQADIPGTEIGKIFIDNKHTLVDVPENRVSDLLRQSGNLKMHHYKVEIKLPSAS